MPSKKYDSQFDAFKQEKQITPANRLCEKIFQKRAEAFKKEIPADNFWNLDEYKGSYTGQVIEANRLLKKYSFEAIYKALEDPQAKYVLSFKNKKIIPIIEKHQKEIDKEKEKTEIVLTKDKKQQTKTIKPFGKQSLWSKLE